MSLIRTIVTRRNIFRRGLHVIRTVPEIRAYRKQCVIANQRVGFVPTMGALHHGHIQLMLQSKNEADVTMASIFVNPTQFSKGEDLDKYPRTLQQDLEKLEKAGVDCVFVPDGPEMYARWPSTKQLCHVEPPDFNAILEGKARPEFFRGVATVVCKLFNIVQPDVAFFGQKDISQCILIRNLVTDLNMPIDIRVVETIREPKDNLAMSSRNTYLQPHERDVAGILYKALDAARLSIESSASIIDREQAIEIAMQVLRSEPLVTHVEYISIASHIDMKELFGHLSPTTGAVISSAIRLGSVRLIDNLLVGKAKEIMN